MNQKKWAPSRLPGMLHRLVIPSPMEKRNTFVSCFNLKMCVKQGQDWAHSEGVATYRTLWAKKQLGNWQLTMKGIAIIILTLMLL